MDTVHCSVHGPQERTFVCQHIVQTLRDRTCRGFFWSSGNDPRARGDAWCAACDSMLEEAGGEWTEEIEEQAGISILCGACYDEAKRLNGF